MSIGSTVFEIVMTEFENSVLNYKLLKKNLLNRVHKCGCTCENICEKKNQFFPKYLYKRQEGFRTKAFLENKTKMKYSRK